MAKLTATRRNVLRHQAIYLDTGVFGPMPVRDVNYRQAMVYLLTNGYLVRDTDPAKPMGVVVTEAGRAAL